MNDNMKKEFQDIEIPEELHTRVELAVNQYTKNGKKKSRYPKWIIAAVASIAIIGITWTFGGSYISSATENLMTQVFGSKEKFLETYPNEKENVSEVEQHLAVVKKHLSAEEFADYSQLVREHTEIKNKMTLENRKVPTPAEQKRLNEIGMQGKKYEEKIRSLTRHTLAEAQKMVSYPINKPTFLPEGYKLEEIEARTKENNIGKDPIVKFQYRKGEFGFRTIHEKLASKEPDEIELFGLKHFVSYKVKNYKLVYAYSEDTNIKGMKIEVPDKGYKINMIADVLSKEEMEKVLLSMVE
ncbi:MAG TPA: hypothetical protein DDY49_13660 [Paenibacillaceae bacterium]|nr:hypothetical protein [Paenibacillaceae bacterium]